MFFHIKDTKKAKLAMIHNIIASFEVHVDSKNKYEHLKHSIRHTCSTQRSLTKLKPMLKYAIPAKTLTSLIRQLTIGLLSAMASLVIGFISILLTIIILEYSYELHHPIAVGEKDLGIGLMVMCWIAFALLLATPLMLWLSCRIYRFITKMLSKRHSH